MILSSLHTKLQHWLSTSQKPLQIEGVGAELWAYFLKLHTPHLSETEWGKSNHIIVAKDSEEAEDFYSYTKRQLPGYTVHLLPGFDLTPYSGVIPAESTLFHRFRTLSYLATAPGPHVVITSFDSFSLLGPPPSFFREHQLSLEVSDVVDPHELSSKLVELGYVSSTTVEEPGTFSGRGEIFDIYPTVGKPVRLHYFDDMIEEIFSIDLETQKTNRDEAFETISLQVAPRIFSGGEFSSQLRENLPMPKPKFKEKYEKRKDIFERLSRGILFESYPFYVPLFFKNPVNVYGFLEKGNTYVTFLNEWEISQEAPGFSEELWREYENDAEDVQSSNILPTPDKLYRLETLEELQKEKTLKINPVGIQAHLDDNLSERVTLRIESAQNFINQNVNPTLPKDQHLKETFLFIAQEFKHEGKVIFSSPNPSSRDEIQHLIDLYELPESFRRRFEYQEYKLSHGFYYSAEKVLLLTDGDLFSVKQNRVKKTTSKNVDLFAEQLATLKEGDYVVHNEHGMGVYKGLQSLEIGDQSSDFLVLEYTGQDKIYLPVYKMNLIQKHAESSAQLKPDSLRTHKFSKAKSRAKESAKKLAFDLLKLQAERQSSRAYAFNPPDHLFKEFELSFPFEETPDQAQAIHDVIESMQKPTPMDYLVCGDVGFGKTEVAMRAAFKAVLDHKQVAMLVPTTVLALQHYNSFIRRFKGFAVNIEFLSRFKSQAEIKRIKEDLKEGKIDIIIGTHKLLSDQIKFHDLGIVIVDEEQRFGVSHKEKLKVMKSSVDFLTLTATPIPRTLQLAFLGIRDLALIKTAPPKRQSIKSYLIKEDTRTIQSAIRKEVARGGQVFIVHNRVQDMENYEHEIRELVPETEIITAHGQMPEKELEKRMNAFYSGQYQILISTTIIESGLDIPNANTMIIDRADTFGLAQLHQLRGRIGRSDRKAYCYFVIPHTRKLNTIAEKRLKALQTYADVGSGFNIATSDLEIRGAGDILGGEQSGHIENVGLELYMDLLKEAVNELKGEKQTFNKDIEINAPFSSYIPNNYISDASERLRLYKKLSNCQSMEDIEEIQQEIVDMYGAFPQELKNLMTILEVRLNLQLTGIKSLQMGGKIVTLNFDKDYLETNTELRNLLVESFISRPKTYQFTPDYKLIYHHKSEMGQADLIKFSKDIGDHIRSLSQQ